MLLMVRRHFAGASVPNPQVWPLNHLAQLPMTIPAHYSGSITPLIGYELSQRMYVARS
jgi:hypothetical protein